MGRNRAASTSWLVRCQSKKPWAAPSVPADAERRKESADETRAVAKTTIHRLLSRRRDTPLRKKTLWRMLYETAARAAEILALNVEDLDLEHRRTPVRSKGRATEWVYWDSGTAHLLPPATTHTGRQHAHARSAVSVRTAPGPRSPPGRRRHLPAPSGRLSPSTSELTTQV
ncbi:tyrosine-type recombinase/integrase [Nonomuraea jabiensis]|uniref:tyrosine-type recombinase/integrase n=1 Tax=Nonomuraea jabiensis TaxID=882448 RepID=UPI0036B78E29